MRLVCHLRRAADAHSLVESSGRPRQGCPCASSDVDGWKSNPVQKWLVRVSQHIDVEFCLRNIGWIVQRDVIER